MVLYEWRNKSNGKSYYGITSNIRRRTASHKSSAKRGLTTPFYAAIRKYGWDNFDLCILSTGTPENIALLEQLCIANDATCYNLHLGGHIGFDVTSKDRESVCLWKAKLRESRKGKTPFANHKHTDDVKALCGEYGKLRWDIYGRYPNEVIQLSFKDAHLKYGISKTHYYRLRKAATN